MTSGSNQQSSSNPQRPDSPILIMDPETFAFCRLYTTIGAEITMGDVCFTPNHDRFANMEIPQEVVENISRTLNDAPEDGSLPFTECSPYSRWLSVIRNHPGEPGFNPSYYTPFPSSYFWGWCLSTWVIRY
ncbi:hypothetical protein LIER_04269 [Lithospermum erythrorhizon]|uniref:Uncharacterized protein n=1 Tax=Lithospermum erythrorhizon TaxID=34254 RepID=A0AAV3NYX2_LITER